jgi:hypothetical protein
MKFKKNNKKIKILDKHIIKVPQDFRLPDILNQVKKFRESNPNLHALPKVYLFFDAKHINIFSTIHYQVLFRSLKDLNQDFGVILPNFIDSMPSVENLDLIIADGEMPVPESRQNSLKQDIVFKKGSENAKVQLNADIKTPQEEELEMYKESLSNIKQQAQKVLPSHQIQNRGFKKILTFCTVLSLVGFFTIAAFAFPNTTLTIVPKISSIEQVLNIHLYQDKPSEINESSSLNKLKVYNFTVPQIQTNVRFVSTGVNNIGTNAKGKVKITNTAPKPFNLVPFTRFQTEDGLIFRSQDFIYLEAATPSNPTFQEVEVTADAFDLVGVGVGQRGNLKLDTKLTLPGLKESSKNLISAQTLEDFTGGTTKIEKFVKDTDLVAASEFAQKELRVKLAGMLAEGLDQKNQTTKEDLVLLESPETMNVNNIKLEMDNNLIGQKLHSFQIKVSADLNGYAYSKSSVENILRSKLLSNLDPHNTLKNVDFKNLNYKVFKSDADLGTFDATFVITGLQQAQLSGSTMDVQKVFNQLKLSVLGQPTDMALEILKENPLVETAEIKSFPAWKSNITNNINNLKVIVNESIPRQS